MRRTRDWDNPGPLGHYPGQRELNRSGVFATGPRLRKFKQHHVFGQGIGLEAWQVMPPIGAVEPLAWVDVTDAGFDAGIRYGGTVPEDMVARRLSADIRWVIAASPDYLERYGTPEHPDDLLHHRCISNRLGDDRVYRWELARDGETYQMTVPGSVTVNHAETGLVAVLGGAGLMYFPEPLVAPYIKDGRLRLVLTEWSPLEEGFHIYYSSRRQLPTGLRLLIEFIQEARPLGL